METNLLAQGVDLMLVGMGTVFVFLTALVGATTAMSALAKNGPAAGVPNTAASEEEIAAITAAISRHRQK